MPSRTGYATRHVAHMSSSPRSVSGDLHAGHTRMLSRPSGSMCRLYGLGARNWKRKILLLWQPCYSMA